MDTIHDIPARQESSGGVAYMAQTIAMLADSLARRQMVADPTRDAQNRNGPPAYLPALSSARLSMA